jgi:hypothetical protein
VYLELVDVDVDGIEVNDVKSHCFSTPIDVIESRHQPMSMFLDINWCRWSSDCRRGRKFT